MVTSRATVLAVVLPLITVFLCVGCTRGLTDAQEPTTAPATPQMPAEPQVVTFYDENLEAAIRGVLGKSTDEVILSTELAELRHLEAMSAGINDLSGLEHCINLASLQLWGNNLSDISPLSSLEGLTSLNLDENQLDDVSPLSSLKNLINLTLAGNPISDISPLSYLENLEVLDLASCKIRDISPVSRLTRLRILCLQENRIKDISCLSSLSNLTDLRLTQNQITDISPLVENIGLKTGDTVLLGGNDLDLSEDSHDLANIRILREKGVVVSLDPRQWAP